MYRKGHIGAALLVYAPTAMITTVAGYGFLAVGGAIAAGGLATLPDYDLRVPFLKHRGRTHTLRFAQIVGFVLAGIGTFLGGTLLEALAGGLFGFVVGFGTIGSHIAADALTPMGVEPYHDDRHYSFDVVRAANPLANTVLLGLGILAVLIGLGLGNALHGAVG